jgi:hypothetical protein
MPRLNNAQELFRRLDSLQVFRQAGSTQTTLGAAYTAGATALNVASMTGFTANDAVIVAGSDGAEVLAVTAVTPTSAVPLLQPAVLANPSGSLLYRATAVNLGELEESSIRMSGQAPLVPINSALKGFPIAYFYGYGDFSASFGLLGFNILNLQTIFGITESEIGTGASATPWAGALKGGNVGTQGIQCLRATGVRQDGSTVVVDFGDAKIEPQGEISLARNAATPLPCTLRCTTIVVRHWL